MDFLAFSLLATQCAPSVHAQTMYAVVKTESSFNPYAIGVVNGRLKRQPRNLEEALSTAAMLEKKGYNFSVGISQVNKHNFEKYGLTLRTAFDACSNIRAGGEILEGCFASARRKFPSDQQALRASFSCYYSGNFLRGFKPDQPGQTSYVDKVVRNAIATTVGI